MNCPFFVVTFDFELLDSTPIVDIKYFILDIFVPELHMLFGVTNAEGVADCYAEKEFFGV